MFLFGQRRTGEQWEEILAYAASIASPSVTLRQIHYLLVSQPDLGYRNTQADYQQLSRRTAERRRFGGFPAIADLTRSVTVWRTWASPKAFVESIGDDYARDLTEGQATLPILLYEKATLTSAMEPIAMRYGIPAAALRGYSSETLDRQVQSVITREERPVRVLYIGDFDADGEGIEENAETWIDADEWARVAITPEQIREHGLAANTGKPLSSQRRAFLARHGVDIQVEVEALPPDELVRLVEDAILDGWDGEAYERVRQAEEAEQERLQEFLAEWGDQ